MYIYSLDPVDDYTNYYTLTNYRKCIPDESLEDGSDIRLELERSHVWLFVHVRIERFAIARLDATTLPPAVIAHGCTPRQISASLRSL